MRGSKADFSRARGILMPSRSYRPQDWWVLSCRRPKGSSGTGTQGWDDGSVGNALKKHEDLSWNPLNTCCQMWRLENEGSSWRKRKGRSRAREEGVQVINDEESLSQTRYKAWTDTWGCPLSSTCVSYGTCVHTFKHMTTCAHAYLHHTCRDKTRSSSIHLWQKSNRWVWKPG